LSDGFQEWRFSISTLRPVMFISDIVLGVGRWEERERLRLGRRCTNSTKYEVPSTANVLKSVKLVESPVGLSELLN
jgi:hypothetical protein